MKRLFLFVFMALAIMMLPTGDVQAGDNGYDEFGYNRTARMFNGIADGADENLDGLYGGVTTWANDKLLMKWSSEWDRGNAEGWANPPYADAHISNEWNGRVKDGSGETWHYKIIWVGATGAASPYWRDGGYLVWGQFEVIMSHGTSPNEHFWDVLAKSAGYGGPK